MFSTFFGIPLSLGALLTGIGLGLGTKWGVLRYPWTTAKLILILTVILMGAFILGPSVEQMRDGSGEAEAGSCSAPSGISWRSGRRPCSRSSSRQGAPRQPKP